MFKSEFGPTKLRVPVFSDAPRNGENALDKFDYDLVANHIRQCPHCLDSFLVHKRAVDLAPQDIYISSNLDRKVLSAAGANLTVQRPNQRFFAIAFAASLLGAIAFGVYQGIPRDQKDESNIELNNIDQNELVLVDFATT